MDKNIIKYSSLFMFLNKMCFRGIYREGPNGFNHVVYNNHYENYKDHCLTHCSVSRLSIQHIPPLQLLLQL